MIKKYLFGLIIGVFLIVGVSASCEVSESEPNNLFSNAENLDIGSCVVSGSYVLNGEIRSSDDVDVYRIDGPFNSGDTIIANLSTFGELDGVIALFNSNEDLILVNDYRNVYLGIREPFIKYTFREVVDYVYVSVSAAPASDRADGTYSLSISRGSDIIPSKNPSKVLLVFEESNNVRIGSRPPVDVPAWENSNFLNEHYPNQIQYIKEKVVENIRKNYKDFNVTILTSDETSFEPGMSRIYFGTFDAALLGISEGIDEFNVDNQQEAIVFLETFEAFFEQNVNPSADEIAFAIANIASHELGHLTGLIHTMDPDGIMDTTTNYERLTKSQRFKRSPIYKLVFPIGYQNSIWYLGKYIGYIGEESCTDYDDSDYPIGLLRPSVESFKIGWGFGEVVDSHSVRIYDSCHGPSAVDEAYCSLTGEAKKYTGNCHVGENEIDTCYSYPGSSFGDFCSLAKSCEDSDNSYSPTGTDDPSLLTKGIVEYYYRRINEIYGTSSSFVDSCVGDKISEGLCINGLAFYDVLDCPSGKVCNNGVCENPPASCENECGRGSSERNSGCLGSEFSWTCGEANDGDDCLDKILTSCGSGFCSTSIARRNSTHGSKGVGCIGFDSGGFAGGVAGEEIGLNVGPCPDCVGEGVSFNIDGALIQPEDSEFASDGYARSSWVVEEGPEAVEINIDNFVGSTQPLFDFGEVGCIDSDSEVGLTDDELLTGGIVMLNDIKNVDSCNGNVLTENYCSDRNTSASSDIDCATKFGADYICARDDVLGSYCAQTGVICGDGVREGNEECDDGNSDRETCTYGDSSGCEVCDNWCKLSPGIVSYCGDGVVDVNNGESCDGNDLNSESCNTNGYYRGGLGCTSSCEYDYSDCSGLVCTSGDYYNPSTDSCFAEFKVSGNGVDYGVDLGVGYGVDLKKAGNSWSEVQDATSADGIDFGNYGGTLTKAAKINGLFLLYRTMFPFDTSRILSSSEILSATLKLPVWITQDDYSGNNGFVNVYSATPSDPENIAITDYDKFGDVAGSNNYMIAGYGGGFNLDFELNSVGLGWINKNGFSTIGLRSGYDLFGIPDTSEGKSFDFNSYSPDYKPVLLVEYSRGVLPVCGNNITEAGEQCDSSEIKSCRTSADTPGVQSCKSDCSGYEVCGKPKNCRDNICEANEGEDCVTCSRDCGTCGGGTCFLADTKISTANGTKDIEDLKVGDKVLSVNEESGLIEEKEVTKTFTHVASDYLIINDKLRVTSNHPMQINGVWKEIGKAKVGDVLTMIDEKKKIFSIEKVEGDEPVYNVEVSGNHNYFAEGYLAHNKQRGLGRGALLSPPIDEEKGFFGRVWEWIFG